MKQQRTNTDNRRSRWFADPPLQCRLLAQTILYWMYSVGAIGAIALVWIVFARHPQTPAEWIDQLWLNCGPLVVGSVLMLPLVLLDCVRFSRRFAGPMVRFRRALRDLAEGDSPAAIELRENDFWAEFARDLNRVSERLAADGLDKDRAETSAAASSTNLEETFPAMDETTDFKPSVPADLAPNQAELDQAARPISPAATGFAPLTGESAAPSVSSIYG